MSETLRRAGRRSHATIKEVAELAGVSQMTVSRVLNRRESVRDSTRTRVEEAIRELNYRPNLLARGLAGGKSLFIGLIYHNPSSSYLGELLVGALHQCRDEGHHLVIEDFSSEDMSAAAPQFAERLGGAGLDGVIVAPPMSEDDDILDALTAAQIPTVLIAPKDISRTDISVSMDDSEAAEAMTRLIIANGHRKVGFIRGPENHSSARRRYRGFKSAMAKEGVAFEDSWIGQGDYTYRSGMLAAETILALPDRPTAIFACNDDMAAGVVAAANRIGLRVPDDLSVTGFDDTIFASAIWPQLTTVRQPIAHMAASSVTLLARHISAGSGEDGEAEAERNVVLDYEIVSRGSLKQL
ncbi:LacI family DNA-binding transcriptional regulator [Hyphomonas sp.]|uniref:LacI family DNA-binding transcriptional regulator n=1 Tax=Hyphomonas sp. TaxID=87 RepID=UPI00391D29D7